MRIKDEQDQLVNVNSLQFIGVAGAYGKIIVYGNFLGSRESNIDITIERFEEISEAEKYLNELLVLLNKDKCE